MIEGIAVYLQLKMQNGHSKIITCLGSIRTITIYWQLIMQPYHKKVKYLFKLEEFGLRVCLAAERISHTSAQNETLHVGVSDDSQKCKFNRCY